MSGSKDCISCLPNRKLPERVVSGISLGFTQNRAHLDFAENTFPRVKSRRILPWKADDVCRELNTVPDYQ